MASSHAMYMVLIYEMFFHSVQVSQIILLIRWPPIFCDVFLDDCFPDFLMKDMSISCWLQKRQLIFFSGRVYVLVYKIQHFS